MLAGEMKFSCFLLFLLGCSRIKSSQCFQTASYPNGGKRKPLLRANENEDFMPETSFGAEVVPEGQRPVNEYLDMRSAPLFGWASNEAGSTGVSMVQRYLS